MRNIFLCIFSVIIFSACNDSVTKENTLTLNIKNSHPQKIYLYKLGFFENSNTLIDTFQNQDLDKSLTFHLPYPDSQIYQLIVSPFLPSVFFINDTIGLTIDINMNDYLNYEIKDSRVNRQFVNLHKKLFGIQTKLSDQNLANNEKKHLRTKINEIYYQTAISSTDPELALFAASMCNFDSGIDKLITLNENFKIKFTDSKEINKFISQTNNIIAAKTKEYYIGDTLPVSEFKNLLNKKFINTATTEKFQIYDFFSVLQRNHLEIEALKTLSNHAEIYSFPIENDSLLVFDYINKNTVNWPHFSDFKGWYGDIISKYNIDSIPYLFVTDRSGVITHKNTPVNKLVKEINQYK